MVISRLVSRLVWVIRIVVLLITLLITTHEPPSRVLSENSGCRAFGFDSGSPIHPV